MNEKRRRSRAEWEALLARQKQEGWSDDQLAEQTGTSVVQVRHWQRCVGGRRVGTLIEVPMVVSTSGRETRLRVGTSLEFVLGTGWTVAEVAELARLVSR